VAADPALRLQRRPARRLHPHARRVTILRAAGALAVAALALVAGATSHAGNGRVLAVNGSPFISASGDRVAVLAYSDGNCGPAYVWAPKTNHSTRLKDRCSSDSSFNDLTLAGVNALWWDYSAGNHVYCDDVYANSKTLGLCDGTAGDVYYTFAGDNTLSAIADYSVCEQDCTDANGNLLPDGDYGVEVARLKGGKVAPLLKPVDFRTFLDARNWRVATIEPKATLTVYDAGGKKVWSVPNMTGVLAGRIDGGSVVLQRTRSVRVYAAAGPGVARPLPKGARFDGVAGGLVVYRTGSSVRVLRLPDGRDRALVTVKGLTGAQITPAGVFYAADVSDTRGVVTFVAMRDVLRRLRKPA
jgi:hypothetical protein